MENGTKAIMDDRLTKEVLRVGCAQVEFEGKKCSTQSNEAGLGWVGFLKILLLTQLYLNQVR